MQFNKSMIELVFEIRRSAPSELKPSIKLANPELFDELSLYYHTTANAVAKALIKELFSQAGDPWQDLLSNQPENINGNQVKVYRGQTSHEVKANIDNHKNERIEPTFIEKEKQEKEKKAKPKRVYRGQIVN